MLRKYFDYFSYAVMAIVILLIILLYANVIPARNYTAVFIFCIALILARFGLRFYFYFKDKDKKTE
ncbi:MAG TPA: hypothetical protein VHP30_00600 [Ignavibacteriales bacterium]|nr:hypothetical protein [Ignavibacteriales bacterium]